MDACGPTRPGRGAGVSRRSGDPWRRAVKVRRIDTHAASVFLAGDRVLKVKRAVHFPFLDYSTLEKRKAACEAEIEVNRALRAANLPRRRRHHARGRRRLAIGGDGRAGRMGGRDGRFDENRTLDHLADEIDDALADALGRAVAAAHAKAPAGRRRAVDRGARLLYRRACRSVPASTRTSFRQPRSKRSRATSRAALSTHRAAAARARPARPDPPHPRRPASRQYRADRRQAGAVRRHRVQRRSSPRATCSTISPSC